MASYTIRVHDENGDSTETRLTGNVSSVGRRKSNDLLILHKSVSGRHGELRFDGKEVSFVDIGSTNGTFNEDGERLANGESFALMVGEILQLGDIDIELVDVEVDMVAPVAAPSGGGEMEATSMLSADQMAVLLGDGAAPAPAPAPQAPSGRRAPPRDAPRQPRRRPAEPEPAPSRGPRAARPEPPRPSRPEPELQPVGGDDGDDWVNQHKGDEADEQGVAPARGGAAGGPTRSSRPTPARSDSIPPDDLAGLDDASFMDGFKGLLGGAWSGMLAMVKGWGNHRAAGMDDVKSDFAAAWEVFKPTMTESPIPIAAFAAAAAVFSILGLWVESLSGIFSLLSSLVSVVAVFATAGTYVYFLRRRLEQPISPIDAVKAVVGQWKPFVITMLFCAAVVIPGILAFLLPGFLLGTFILPVYYVEDRGRFGPARRSLYLCKQDFKRIFLSSLCLGVAVAIVSTVFVTILASLGAIVGTIGYLLGAVLQGLTGAFSVCFMVELYFDVRARSDAGDAEQDLRDNLGDPE